LHLVNSGFQFHLATFYLVLLALATFPTITLT
jgi:hypothetical protein